MTEQEILEYKQGILEVYTETGTTQLEYYARLNPKPTTDDDIYGEYNEEEGYAQEPVMLVADIQLNNQAEDTLNKVPLSTITTYIVDIPILCLENNNLDPYIMCTGRFKYKGKDFTILDVMPDGLLADTFTSYKFIAERV